MLLQIALWDLVLCAEVGILLSSYQQVIHAECWDLKVENLISEGYFSLPNASFEHCSPTYWESSDTLCSHVADQEGSTPI